MKITFDDDTISEVQKPLLPEEELSLMERHKCKVLHEMKMLSVRMNKWMKDGVISSQGEVDKYPDHPKIPDAESRRVLTPDEKLKAYVIATFARFRLLQEVLANSLNPEIEELQKKQNPK